MHWQLVYWSALGSAAGHGPALERPFAAVEDIIALGASKGRRERHVERQVGSRIGGYGGRAGRTPLRLRILMRPRHAKSSRHSLAKPMASLASKAGDFVHGANTPQTPPPREESRRECWKVGCSFSSGTGMCATDAAEGPEARETVD